MTDSQTEQKFKEQAYRHDLFQRHLSAFIERYAPRSYEGRDFEHEIRALVQMAYEEAQYPFIWELNTFRKSVLDYSQTSVRPKDTF